MAAANRFDGLSVMKVLGTMDKHRQHVKLQIDGLNHFLDLVRGQDTGSPQVAVAALIKAGLHDRIRVAMRAHAYDANIHVPAGGLIGTMAWEAEDPRDVQVLGATALTTVLPVLLGWTANVSVQGSLLFALAGLTGHPVNSAVVGEDGKAVQAIVQAVHTFHDDDFVRTNAFGTLGNLCAHVPRIRDQFAGDGLVDIARRQYRVLEREQRPEMAELAGALLSFLDAVGADVEAEVDVGAADAAGDAHAADAAGSEKGGGVKKRVAVDLDDDVAAPLPAAIGVDETDGLILPKPTKAAPPGAAVRVADTSDVSVPLSNVKRASDLDW